MPRFIVKLAEDKYVLWSTVVDAPVTRVMTRAKTVDYMTNVYLSDVGSRVHGEMTLADHGGCGAMTWRLADIVDYNRAGPGEAHLPSVEEILQHYGPPEED